MPLRKSNRVVMRFNISILLGSFFASVIQCLKVLFVFMNKPIRLIRYVNNCVIPPKLINQFSWEALRDLIHIFRGKKHFALVLPTNIIGESYVPLQHVNIIYSILCLVEYSQRDIIKVAGRPKYPGFWNAAIWARRFKVIVQDSNPDHRCR